MATSKLTRDHQRREPFARFRTCRPQGPRFGSLFSDKARQEPVSDAIASNIREILSVASKVASMPDREAIERYHNLIDKRLATSLTPTERFELERIEARLDARDRDPLIEARDREWEAHRARVLDSIHTLLTRLQS